MTENARDLQKNTGTTTRLLISFVPIGKMEIQPFLIITNLLVLEILVRILLV